MIKVSVKLLVFCLLFMLKKWTKFGRLKLCFMLDSSKFRHMHFLSINDTINKYWNQWKM